MRGNLEISQLLFNKGAEINARDEKGDEQTILMHAVANGHEDLVKWLISKGADVNATDNRKQYITPLHLAARYNNNTEVVKILIDRGAFIDALSNNN